jgi:hypothetical protein
MADPTEMAIREAALEEMEQDDGSLGESFVVSGALTKCNASEDPSIRVKLVASESTKAQDGYAAKEPPIAGRAARRTIS